MKTNELTALLATHVEPALPAAAAKRMGIALTVAIACALGVMLWWMGLRADLAVAVGTPMFWVKLAFPVALGVMALFVVLRLARPGASVRRVATLLPLPVLAVWVLAAGSLMAAGPAQRDAMIFGTTWMLCPLNIAGLAIPAFVATFWALADLAPTRLPAAGAAAGLLAGAVGASVYALHCPEAGAAFLGIWYLLGMVAPAVPGALLGPRLLRW